MGRKNAILVGFVAILLSNTALGMLSYLSADKVKTFFYLSCVARFVQGYGDSLAMATSMSLISTNFPKEKEKYISYIGASMGFGLMIGPPIGSVIYGNFGFAWVFYFFSIWIFLMFIGQIVFIPNSYNQDKKAISKTKAPQGGSPKFGDSEIGDSKERPLFKKKGGKSIRRDDNIGYLTSEASFATARNSLLNSAKID